MGCRSWLNLKCGYCVFQLFLSCTLTVFTVCSPVTCILKLGGVRRIIIPLSSPRRNTFFVGWGAPVSGSLCSPSLGQADSPQPIMMPLPAGLLASLFLRSNQPTEMQLSSYLKRLRTNVYWSQRSVAWFSPTPPVSTFTFPTQKPIQMQFLNPSETSREH